MTKQKIYLAGSLHTAGQRDHLETVASVLEDRYEVFVPHRDGGLYADRLRRGLTMDEAADFTRTADLVALARSDLLLAVVHGRYVTDAGVCFEVGWAVACDIPCYFLAPDLDTSPALNPMIRASIAGVCSRLADLAQPDPFKLPKESRE